MSPAWMPFYVADYLADTGELSTTEHGAYLLLIFAYWQKGELPVDDGKLARITRLTPSQWARIKPTVGSFFDDQWRHKRIDHELAHAADVIEKRRAAVAQREIKRRGNDVSHDPSNDASHDDIRARASPSPSPSPPQAPSLRSVATRARASGWPPEAFERFWRTYPHKVGKKAALRAFAAAERTGVTFEQLMFGLDRYIAEKPADRSWCNPATWLNGGRWDDQPAPAQTGPPHRNGGSFLDIAQQLRERANADDLDRTDDPEIPGLTAPGAGR